MAREPNSKLAQAEREIARAVRLGEDFDLLAYRLIAHHRDHDEASEVLERLADVATQPLHRAQFRCQAVVLRVTAGQWVDFEPTLRRAWNAIRTTSAQSGMNALHRNALIRDVALAYVKYLCASNRSRHALRVLRHLSTMDCGTTRHLAETHAGLICLDLDQYKPAIAHLSRSVDVADVEEGYPVRLLPRTVARVGATQCEAFEFSSGEIRQCSTIEAMAVDWLIT